MGFIEMYVCVYIYIYGPLGKSLRKAEVSGLPVLTFLCKREVNGLLQSDPIWI